MSFALNRERQPPAVVGVGSGVGVKQGCVTLVSHWTSPSLFPHLENGQTVAPHIQDEAVGCA